jgi:threonine aldolase
MTSIDLRSDTVTRPDAAMRRAMAEAEVGDDVFAEDPTVRRLEETTAELLGHEAGLFVPSGTMGNQIGLHLHARPGSEVICDSRSHVVFYEMGALAALSGLLPRTIESAWGQLEPAAVEALIAPDVSYRARTALILVENSHNVCGGTVYTPEQLDAVVGVARRRGLPVHLDGARLWNAAVSAGVPESRFSAGVDTVNVCLSKGLGAPVGSVLCGSADRMKEARRVRKMFGGGMRQVGVLAAAGLVALGNRARLAKDHEHARLLAETLADLPGTVVDLDHVVTNIVVFGITAEFFRAGLGPALDPIDEFLARLADHGVRAVRISPTRARFTTHGDVDRAGIEAAVAAIRALAA